jgi:dolichol-phosphate mannosyltransferase
MLSVIIPAYNEQDNVAAAASAVSKLLSLRQIDYELIFINDGSSDRTWQRLMQLSASDEHIKAVNFSRNFGKEAAIFAGLENASGDACVIMDCDLQHPPETVVEMYDVWKESGADIVEGKKRSRGNESSAHRMMAGLFYKIIERVSGLNMSDSSDFKLLDRRAVEALLRMPERLTFFRAMSSWVGFNTVQIRRDLDYFVYLRADAACDRCGSDYIYHCGDFRHRYACKHFLRQIRRRLPDRNTSAADYLVDNNVQPWNNRLLSLKNI